MHDWRGLDTADIMGVMADGDVGIRSCRELTADDGLPAASIEGETIGKGRETGYGQNATRGEKDRLAYMNLKTSTGCQAEFRRNGRHQVGEGGADV